MIRITTHPGEYLKEEFLEALGMSARSLASAIDVPPNRITEIINGDRSVTADTAIRLSRYFGTTSQFWINLQAAYDLSRAESENKKAYEAIKPRPLVAA